MTHTIKAIIALACVATSTLAVAQVNSQSDGSDGALNPSATTTTIDLGLAPTTAWTSPGTGNGVYDGSKWAVVFKYSSVNIAAGKTVKFTNHPKNPPVVWLVQGDVTISGTVNLDAQLADNTGQLTIAGPGGFRGASNDSIGLSKGSGFGPGGSSSAAGYNAIGASYSSQPTGGVAASRGPVYGNDQVLPLVGGSGSMSRGPTVWGGGAGGGAILIVASGTITINGVIQADGSTIGGYLEAPGSGGAIRLVANQITGTGVIKAQALNGDPFWGGAGRIRLERLNASSSFPGTSSPAPSTAVLASPDPVIWPTSSHPRLSVTTVDGVPVPSDPTSNFVSPDLQVGPAAANIIRLEAANIPTDGTWRVQVRIVPRSGVDLFATATLVSGNQVASIWEASVALPPGGSAVIARAYKL